MTKEAEIKRQLLLCRGKVIALLGYERFMRSVSRWEKLMHRVMQCSQCGYIDALRILLSDTSQRFKAMVLCAICCELIERDNEVMTASSSKPLGSFPTREQSDKPLM